MEIPSSSSSGTMRWKYDVFVSFRGEDTINNFTDHLFAALNEKGFAYFRKGESTLTDVLQAIEESKILIVVFSKDYASSTWCLQELAKIADCVGVQGQTVLPIFYDVNPFEVRKQSGNYGKAFEEHEERFKDDLEVFQYIFRFINKKEIVQSWREALSQVANLYGLDLNDKPQHGEIEKIVKKVSIILSYNFSTPTDGIVGMQSSVEEFEKLLSLDSHDDVRVVGVCGMGGVGKSTLATILYYRIYYQFDAACYIDDVSKLFRDYGPMEVQRQILSQTSNEENLHQYNPAMETNLMRTKLRHKKILIVLDNVDQVRQVDKLDIKREWLGAASRIIVVSRDEHILQEYQADKVYKVQLLNDRDALQLFRKKAFRCDDIQRDYIHLETEVLEYAKGLPLAIKVLGSFLSGRDVSEWRSALVRLRQNPAEDIMDVLRISFDALMDKEKEIFLDISCFFHEHSREYVEHLLDIRGFYPQIGMRVLLDKSLITINRDGCITMFDLLRELGKSIVREMSPKEPRKWSRLWDYNDFHNVMLENMVAENLEAIFIERFEVEFAMRVDAFSKMIHLKLLQLPYVNLKFSGSLDYLSSELQYLHWINYPFQYLPPHFRPDNLVELVLRRSSIKQLWKDSKPLHHLRKMDLSHSKNLIKMPNFRDVPNLESLRLEGCIKLVQIDPSIGILTKLDYLDLRNCKNLVSIPNNIFGLSSLKYLNLSGCSKLYKNWLLEKPRHGEHVEINETSMQLVFLSIFKILKSPVHCFYCGRHEESIGLMLLPPSARFLCLKELDLSFCNLQQIPDAIGLLHSLMSLNLGGNNFVTLPSSTKELSKLLVLNLEHCMQLKYLPEVPVRSNACFDHFEAGLYIFNCPNLIEFERCYNLAFSWMIQLLQVHMESSLRHGEIDIVIPGAEIPRWFNKQNAGSSITMDLTPYIHDENCIGLAFSATLLLADNDPTNLCDAWLQKDIVWFTFQFKNNQRKSIFPMCIRKDLITVESNHLLLQFFTLEAFISGNRKHDMDSMELLISTRQPQGVHMEVTNCGYHWIFKEDLVNVNSKMMHTGSSSVSK